MQCIGQLPDQNTSQQHNTILWLIVKQQVGLILVTFATVTAIKAVPAAAGGIRLDVC